MSDTEGKSTGRQGRRKQGGGTPFMTGSRQGPRNQALWYRRRSSSTVVGIRVTGQQECRVT